MTLQNFEVDVIAHITFPTILAENADEARTFAEEDIKTTFPHLIVRLVKATRALVPK